MAALRTCFAMVPASPVTKLTRSRAPRSAESVFARFSELPRQLFDIGLQLPDIGFEIGSGFGGVADLFRGSGHAELPAFLPRPRTGITSTPY